MRGLVVLTAVFFCWDKTKNTDEGLLVRDVFEQYDMNDAIGERIKRGQVGGGCRGGV